MSVLKLFRANYCSTYDIIIQHSWGRGSKAAAIRCLRISAEWSREDNSHNNVLPAQTQQFSYSSSFSSLSDLLEAQWADDWWRCLAAEPPSKVMHEWMNGWMNEWMHEWMNEWTNECTNERTNAWMHERTNEWMNAWMNERMNECMNAQTSEWRNEVQQVRQFRHWNNE